MNGKSRIVLCLGLVFVSSAAACVIALKAKSTTLPSEAPFSEPRTTPQPEFAEMKAKKPQDQKAPVEDWKKEIILSLPGHQNLRITALEDWEKIVLLGKLTNVWKEKVLVSVSPITNRQYRTAVEEKALPAPMLPWGLRPEQRKSNPDLPPNLNPAPWEFVAWQGDKHPKGQGDNAILFVTRGEAQGYCRWLERHLPAFSFRLPTSSEAACIGNHYTHPGRRILERENAFPRPVEGTGAIRSKGRFWLAPMTHELIDYSDVDPSSLSQVAKLKQSPQMRYWTHISATAWEASVLPNTFRVMAVPK